MRKLGLAAFALALTAAGQALAQSAAGEPPLTVLGVFVDATWYIKLVMVVLLLAAGAALVVWALALRKVGVADAKGLAGALGRLKIIRSGAIPLGVLAASYILTYGFIGMANARQAPSVTVLAQGWAEAGLAVMLGCLAATVAVVCERHLEAKIRQAAV